MGRWSYRLLVVTIYQVYKASINTSSDLTAFTQQWKVIRATGDKTPNPRAKFTSDLSNFLAEYPNDPIILAGDINSWLGTPNDDKNFENLVRRHNLKDVLIRSHGPDSEIPTRKEESRIDYIFASEIITDNTLRC
jgi:endonuclease/exonuclease/phosphatase family metal-dependent hydrolase